MTSHKRIHPLKRIVRHPLSRTLLFVLAVVVSVWVGHLIRSHSQAIEAGAVSLGAVIARGLEVLTDVICDRVFPEG
jgi:hypothetical protein